MAKLTYSLSIPQKAMDLLAEIAHLKKETKEEKVQGLEQEIEEMERSYGLPLIDWKTENQEWLQSRVIDIDDYHAGQAKIQQLKARLKSLPPESITHASAIPLDHLQDKSGLSREQIQRYLRIYLYGLVGVIQDTFQGSSPTGKEVAPDLKPSLGGKGVIMYTADGKSIDKRALTVNKQYGLFVPASLSPGIGTCMDDGPDERGRFHFQGEIDQSSLPILRYISERTQELKERYPGNWTPEFTLTELVNRTGLSQTAAATAQKDLVGLLTEVYYLRNYKTRHKFFLPSCREDLAGELLHQYPDHRS